MAYRLEYDPVFQRRLRSLPKQIQRRILARLELLKTDPRASGCIKLSGEEGYRVLGGRLSIALHNRRRLLIVLMVDVGHRREIYRNR